MKTDRNIEHRRVEQAYQSVADSFDQITTRYRVPGASLAVSVDDQLLHCQAGVRRLGYSHPITPDTAFQVGSNTKILTAIIAFRLIEQGKLGLSDPLSKFVPEITEKAFAGSEPLKIEHLLAHTSGLEGDLFLDIAGNIDSDIGLENFLQHLLEIDPVLPAGQVFSYCNSGFNLLGLIAQRITGRRWAELMVEMILEPLGMRSARLLAAHDGRADLAFGHVRSDAGEFESAERQFFPTAYGPSGASLVMSAADLGRFGRAFLSALQGDATGGPLEKSSAQTMTRNQIEVPGFWVAKNWGLGIASSSWGDNQIISHGGVTIGQYSYFDMIPDRNIVIALLTNGGDAPAFRKAIYDLILPDLIGAGPPDGPQIKGGPVASPQKYEGTYCTATRRITVREADEGLCLESLPTIDSSWADPASVARFEQSDGPIFAAKIPGAKLPQYCYFGGTEDERAAYLHIGGRAFPRIEQT